MLAASLLAAVVLAAAPQRMESAFQPETYTSPSGEWTVLVDPKEWDGRGPATYSVEHGGTPTWSAEFPFTFQDAVIDDAGYLAGFATVVPKDEPRALGQFVVALISPSGAMIAKDATDREANRFTTHSTPDPKAYGVLLDPEHQRFVVRIAHPREAWSWFRWVPYDLRSGERLEEFVPHELAGYSLAEDDGPAVLTAEKVSGTPAYATVGQGYRFDVKPRVHDLVVEVFDTTGQPIGRATHEHAIEGDRNLWREVIPNVLTVGDAPGDFSVWLPRTSERVHYRVFQLPNDEGWDLKELRRTEYAPTVEVQARAVAEDVDLRLIAEVELNAPAPAPELFERVHRFGFDELGRVMVIERDETAKNLSRCLLLTPEGELVYERTVELPEAEGTYSDTWTPFENGQWLVLVERYEDDEPDNAEAWWVDPAVGQIVELPHWRESITERGLSIYDPAIASTRDGGFLYGGSISLEYTSATRLAAFNRDGTIRWVRGEFGAPSNSVAVFGMDGLTISAGGDISTLVLFDTLSHFSSEGTWRESIDLAELWEGDLGIPRLHADPVGGFVVFLDSANALARRIDADGSIREELELTRADGSSDSMMAFRGEVAPDGRLWTSDGFTLMRHGEDGVADLTLGGAPDVDALYDAATIEIDPWGGRVLVQDQRTAALHVFGADGARQFVAHPAEGDHDSLPLMGGSGLVAHPDGRLYQSTFQYPDTVWIEFTPSGERVGTTGLGGRKVSFCSNGQRWHLARKNTRLLGEDLSTLATVTRRADGRWFEFPDDLAAAPDGGVAIIDRAEPFAISLYEPDGTPIADHDLPEGAGSVYYIARSGAWVAAWGWNEHVWLLRVEDGQWLRFPAPWPVNGNARIEVGFSSDGSELWLVDGQARSLRRYALPAD